MREGVPDPVGQWLCLQLYKRVQLAALLICLVCVAKCVFPSVLRNMKAGNEKLNRILSPDTNFISVLTLRKFFHFTDTHLHTSAHSDTPHTHIPHKDTFTHTHMNHTIFAFLAGHGTVSQAMVTYAVHIQ